MKVSARKLTLSGWDALYPELRAAGMMEPPYGGPLRQHMVKEGDLRLRHLSFDSSPASLRLWNFVLSENERLRQARNRGDRLVGAMKDLGTVPVMAYSLPGVRAFYPDGAWWTPCLMEDTDGLLQQAEALGIDSSFCPVRAMLAAFQNEKHFPRPDLLVCSTGAICDDFSAVAQRLAALGYPVMWWEMPRRRRPEPGENSCLLPGNLIAPQAQVDCVSAELKRIAAAFAKLAARTLDEPVLTEGIRRANRVRRSLRQLRERVYSAAGAPLPALEMLLAEVLAIHFCSDLDETCSILSELLDVAECRIERNEFVVDAESVRIFWVNPVADLRAMNLLEDWGGRICGSDFMFTHALDEIPEEVPPFEGLARTALADPMTGSTTERAERIITECRRLRAEAVVVARIPGASHCAREGMIIRDMVGRQLGVPVIEIEVPHLCDALQPTVGSRLQALMETARARRSA